MSTNIDELVDRIAHDARCEIEWRDPASPLAPPGHEVLHIPSGPLPPKLGVILPPDMLRFRERVARANIYVKTVPQGTIPQPNGWNLWGVRLWGFETLTERLDDDEPGTLWDQLSQCCIFGNKGTDGGHLLAVDLRSERYGQIIECMGNQPTYGGDVPVIAHSFSEWLERTLDAGPAIDCGYWEEPGFDDYGSALVDDPCYEARPRHPRGATAHRAEMLRQMGYE